MDTRYVQAVAGRPPSPLAPHSGPSPILLTRAAPATKLPSGHRSRIQTMLPLTTRRGGARSGLRSLRVGRGRAVPPNSGDVQACGRDGPQPGSCGEANDPIRSLRRRAAKSIVQTLSKASEAKFRRPSGITGPLRVRGSFVASWPQPGVPVALSHFDNDYADLTTAAGK
jgi:hypothetical protein